MRSFDYVRAKSLDHCLDVLSEHGNNARIIAGGTDLHVLMGQGLVTPRIVVDIGSLNDLRFMREENGNVAMGPLCTHAEISTHPVIGDLDCLTTAAASVGSPQIRNVGTAGGNIANASPSGDLYPPLLALNAIVVLKSRRGERQVALEEFITGPGETCIEPDELITRIAFEKPGGAFFSRFVKIGLRNALAISVASAALVATEAGGRLSDVRIACGAVAPTPIRFREIENLLVESDHSSGIIQKAGKLARELCCPITDIRGTGGYRRHVTGTIVTRLVKEAFDRLTSHGGGKGNSG